MTDYQIHDAMRRRLPVIHKGIHYDRIVEYIAWYDSSNNLRLSVNLLDGRSLVRVLANEVELDDISSVPPP